MLERLLSLFRIDTGKRDRNQGTTVFWIIAGTASALLLLGWLLPWFVNDYSAGVGYSAQDALVSSPTGIGTFCIYIMAVAMVILVLSPFADAIARARGRAFGKRADRIRFIAALVGLALTAVVWFLVSVIQEEPLFGAFTAGTYTDSAVWLEMYGFAMAALAYGARDWVVARQSVAFGVAALPIHSIVFCGRRSSVRMRRLMHIRLAAFGTIWATA